jgi:hypothetical protein
MQVTVHLGIPCRVVTEPGHGLEALPEPDRKDRVRALAKIGMSAVPYVGGPGAELIELVVPSSLMRRRDDWLRRLAEVVDELRARDVDFEAIVDDERFATALIEASRIALGTHIEEKLHLLKNAIVNMAMPDAPPDFLAARFLRWIEELSPEHFIVLTYGADPADWFDHHGIEKQDYVIGSPRQVMADAKVPVAADALPVVLRDLNDRALADTGSMGAMMSGAGGWGPWVTDLGRHLTRFVTLV